VADLHRGKQKGVTAIQQTFYPSFMREIFFNYYTFSVCLKLCGGFSVPTSVTKENRPLDKYYEIHLQEKNTLLGD
jgi:hypothetical protein